MNRFFSPPSGGLTRPVARPLHTTADFHRLQGLAVLVLLVTLAWPAAAQVASAELSGSILDPTGALVVGAKVSATNVATNRNHETTSNAAGNYIIPLLPPGDYTLTVEAAGFRKAVRRGLTLQINQQANVPVTLEVGEVTQAVEVSVQASDA